MKIPVKAGAMILCLCAAAGILFAVHNVSDAMTQQAAKASSAKK